MLISSTVSAVKSGPRSPQVAREGNSDGLAGSTEATPAWADLGKLQYRPSELNGRLDALFARAARSANPVVASLEPVIRNAKFVKMDLEALKKQASQLTPEQLKPANWKFPHYIEEDSQRTMDFFMVANSINFLFFDPDSGEKYKTEFNGKEYTGADGMIAGLKRAMQEGVPVLDAAFLANVSREEMAHIFRGNFELPLLDERLAIFHEVGTVLQEKYQGHFSNLVEQSGGRAFDGGNGIVERLTQDFPSFRDTSPEGHVYNKRAQLAVGMLHSRLEDSGLFQCPDVGELTVFADYQLPRGLRNMGILQYDSQLAEKVDQGQKIPRDSQMEQEMRAFTIVAAELLREELHKNPEHAALDSRGLDSFLWLQARQDKNSKPHVTVTTAY
ncbi:MAG: queuosine salvage family protein [Candidatus Eremiobacteraeota bacterium]|nr:queuosine salvage family protein [Candidatus Eremiobacteraeota bacterium]